METKYKPSMFNEYLGCLEGKWVLYNNYSAAMIEVPEMIYNSLQAKRFDALSQKNRALLEQTGFIVHEGKNEIEELRNKKKFIQDTNAVIGLQILPTLACNFDCPYCYERMLEDSSKMSREIMDGAISWVNHTVKSSTQVLNVMWYGGEPLLALDEIEYLSKQFLNTVEKNSLKYYASIVTNGYLLNADAIDILQKSRVNSCMVTIDGPETLHNRRRILKNGGKTFSVIMENLKTAVSKGMSVTIRVNLDKQNIGEVDKLLASLADHGLLNIVGFCFGLVTRFGYACTSIDDTLLQEDEVEKIMDQKSISDILSDGKNFANRIPPDLVGCVATAANSYVVAPNGSLFKCSKNVGNNSECCGTILNPDKSHPNYVKWVSLDNMYDSSCCSCSLIPICRGDTCAYDILFNSKNKLDCVVLKKRKGYLDKLKRTYINQKKGEKNG